MTNTPLMDRHDDPRTRVLEAVGKMLDGVAILEKIDQDSAGILGYIPLIDGEIKAHVEVLRRLALVMTKDGD